MKTAKTIMLTFVAVVLFGSAITGVVLRCHQENQPPTDPPPEKPSDPALPAKAPPTEFQKRVHVFIDEGMSFCRLLEIGFDQKEFDQKLMLATDAFTRIPEPREDSEEELTKPALRHVLFDFQMAKAHFALANKASANGMSSDESMREIKKFGEDAMLTLRKIKKAVDP